MITTPTGYEVTLAYTEAVRHWPFRDALHQINSVEANCVVKGHARLDEYGGWVADFGDYLFDTTGWTSNHEINEPVVYFGQRLSLGFESAESLFAALGDRD